MYGERIKIPIIERNQLKKKAIICAKCYLESKYEKQWFYFNPWDSACDFGQRDLRDTAGTEAWGALSNLEGSVSAF